MDSLLRSALVYICAGTWFVWLVASGAGAPEGFWRPLGAVGLVASVAAFAYDRWLWAIIPTKWSHIPDLRGTWRGTLESNYKDPTTGAAIPAVEAYFVVEQTAGKTVVQMMTNESRSASVAATLEKRDGSTQLTAIYRNEPNAAVRDRSPIHYGGFRLHVSGDAALSMEGDYWTDRSTTGMMKLERCTRTIAGDFGTAQALCS